MCHTLDGFFIDQRIFGLLHSTDFFIIVEVEEFSYFLEEERVDGYQNNSEEEILAPTVTRSLGEDFLLQA